VRIGVDTGGTFTDLVAEDGRSAKVLSDARDPAAAVARGIETLGDGRPGVLAHGTTVATNALLERQGARVALVTTEGLADVVEIARQDRPSLYDPFADRPPPLVERADRLEVAERVTADGSVLVPLDASAVPDIPGGVEAVAVCLLHADLNPAHEEVVASTIASRGYPVSRSSAVSPEFREYERTITTVVDAYLRPACRGYLSSLAALAESVFVLTSAGGLVSLEEAADRPASLLLSGPAGGVRAAACVATANGFADAVAFDMGGTSTDVCLVLGAAPSPAPERVVAGFPVRLPSLDVHTIGAGGGSIARIDAGGALVVGPASAGATPGPACYGRGGTLPTVTDADLVLGNIPTGTGFSGLDALDVGAARAALSRADVTAEGVVAVVDANMEQAVRRVSVARGVDPRGLALIAFGGAGPLHACAVASALGMAAVVVPARAGVLSAVGILGAPRQRDLVRTWPTPAHHAGVDDALVQLAASASRLVGGGATVEVSIDCRYAGQSHELGVPSVDAFHAEHERRNGYARRDAPVEVVALRATARVASPVDVSDVPLPEVSRSVVRGPAVVAEPDCTILVPDGWVAEPGALGAYVLRRTS
jgi:N-methylhydantoinase A/oxoprolinase/acetone carboxylase beta subunit